MNIRILSNKELKGVRSQYFSIDSVETMCTSSLLRGIYKMHIPHEV